MFSFDISLNHEGIGRKGLNCISSLSMVVVLMLVKLLLVTTVRSCIGAYQVLAILLQFTVIHTTFQACVRLLLYNMYRVFVLMLFVATRTHSCAII